MQHTVEALADAFEALSRQRAGDPLTALRREAFARFRALGYPTMRDEEWRYTSLAPIEKGNFALAAPGGNGITPAETERFFLRGQGAARLVFVDGHYRADLSAPAAGVGVAPLALAVAEGHPAVAAHLGRHAAHGERALVALNTALFGDGVLLHVERGVALDGPVEVLFLATGKACFPRNLYVLDEGASAAVVESYVSLGNDAHLTNAVTEAVVGPAAALDHYRIQYENAQALHVGALAVHQARDSRFTSHAATIGGALVRNDIDGVLDDENVVCTLNGLFLARGTQHVDNHTRIEHRKPHGESHELYKGILDGRSTGIFSGKIHVYPDAQKTDAKQASANLLLSEEAVVDAKPQLEIYADDVRCTHGATIGQLDRDALFYLQARGIPAEQARNVLVHAFASDVTRRMQVESVRLRTEELLTEHLPGGSLEA